MEKTITADVVQEILKERFPVSPFFQKCSFITPDGNFLVIQQEHYEAYKWLLTEQLVQCIPDAEQLLNELGYIRYSYIGYITLSDKKPTQLQYKALEHLLYEIQKYRCVISLQLANNPKFYLDVDLQNNVDNIIKSIKKYYSRGELYV